MQFAKTCRERLGQVCVGAAGFGGPHMRNDLSDRVESGNLLEGDPARFWEVRLAIGVRLLTWVKNSALLNVQKSYFLREKQAGRNVRELSYSQACLQGVIDHAGFYYDGPGAWGSRLGSRIRKKSNTRVPRRKPI